MKKETTKWGSNAITAFMRFFSEEKTKQPAQDNASLCLAVQEKMANFGIISVADKMAADADGFFPDQLQEKIDSITKMLQPRRFQLNRNKMPGELSVDKQKQLGAAAQKTAEACGKIVMPPPTAPTKSQVFVPPPTVPTKLAAPPPTVPKASVAPPPTVPQEGGFGKKYLQQFNEQGLAWCKNGVNDKEIYNRLVKDHKYTGSYITVNAWMKDLRAKNDVPKVVVMSRVEKKVSEHLMAQNSTTNQTETTNPVKVSTPAKVAPPPTVPAPMMVAPPPTVPQVKSHATLLMEEAVKEALRGLFGNEADLNELLGDKLSAMVDKRVSSGVTKLNLVIQDLSSRASKADKLADQSKAISDMETILLEQADEIGTLRQALADQAKTFEKQLSELQEKFQVKLTVQSLITPRANVEPKKKPKAVVVCLFNKDHERAHKALDDMFDVTILEPDVASDRIVEHVSTAQVVFQTVKFVSHRHQTALFQGSNKAKAAGRSITLRRVGGGVSGLREEALKLQITAEA